MTATQRPRVITNKVIKDRATFLQRTDGKGSPTVLEIELAPGGGNPPHVHATYDETFTAVRGTLGLKVGGKEVLLEPGQSATARRGTVHNFFNPSSETAVFRVELKPGHQGFERSLIVAYGLANDDLTDGKAFPKNPLHTALLVEMGGMKFTGAMALLMPLLRLVAAYARSRGVERELLRKYDA